MIYLASPYSHWSSTIRKDRYNFAFEFTTAALSLGYPLFSPIVYGHQFAIHKNFDANFRSWQSLNDAAIVGSSEVWVLQLPGWEVSQGVIHEIDLAKRVARPVKYWLNLDHFVSWHESLPNLGESHAMD